MSKKAVEINFDGLVGPTHFYGGLSHGNVASKRFGHQSSSPRQAALQGLDKMKALMDLGFTQGVLMPHERPHLPSLRAAGFSGSDETVIRQAAEQAPGLLSAFSSASSMWTANACTVSPSADTQDGRVHFTPANLQNKLHRAIEHEVTGRQLQAYFAHPDYFAHHPALPSHDHLGDEGAANHTRLCQNYGSAGLEIFVYGRKAFAQGVAPSKYPARQTLEASQAVARAHQVRAEQLVFIQQNPQVIDQGVFHNDVIAVGNGQLLFYHEQAFVDSDQAMTEIAAKLEVLGAALEAVCVPSTEVSVEDAVSTYLFNSQILTQADGTAILVVPEECRHNERVWTYLEKLPANTSIQEVKVFDLKQSMQNGGGPACLRQRIVVNEQERAAMHQAAILTPSLYTELTQWVNRHYRDQLVVDDLKDPSLLDECRTALDALCKILQVSRIYDFQR